MGKISGARVAVADGSAPGVGVEKEMLTAAVGEAACLVGGTKSVGVTVGPQAANRYKNTQDEMQSRDRVLRILGFMFG